MCDDVCLTLDVDWAPDAVVAAALEVLDRAGARATLFATHDSPLLREVAAGGGHEVGLHPNFDAADDGSLEELRHLYPRAVGARSHRLHVSSKVLELYRRHGLRY